MEECTEQNWGSGQTDHDDGFENRDFLADTPLPRRPIRMTSNVMKMHQVDRVATQLIEAGLVRYRSYDCGTRVEVVAAIEELPVFSWGTNGFRYGTTAGAISFVWKTLDIALPLKLATLVLEGVRQRYRITELP